MPPKPPSRSCWSSVHRDLDLGGLAVLVLRDHGVGEDRRGEVAGRGVHPVAGQGGRLADDPGGLHGRLGALGAGGVGEHDDLGRALRVRAGLVGAEARSRRACCPRRRRGPAARRAAGSASATEAALDTARAATPGAPGVRRPRRPRPRSPRPTRISSGDLIRPAGRHLGDLTGLGGEADRGQQRRELAAVGRRDALPAGRGAQALGGADDADDDDVRLGLLGGALAQGVAGHLTDSFDVSRMAVVAL